MKVTKELIFLLHDRLEGYYIRQSLDKLEIEKSETLVISSGFKPKLRDGCYYFADLIASTTDKISYDDIDICDLSLVTIDSNFIGRLIGIIKLYKNELYADDLRLEYLEPSMEDLRQKPLKSAQANESNIHIAQPIGM